MRRIRIEFDDERADEHSTSKFADILMATKPDDVHNVTCEVVPPDNYTNWGIAWYGEDETGALAISGPYPDETAAKIAVIEEILGQWIDDDPEWELGQITIDGRDGNWLIEFGGWLYATLHEINKP